jgi:hypothetical protein
MICKSSFPILMLCGSVWFAKDISHKLSRPKSGRFYALCFSYLYVANRSA